MKHDPRIDEKIAAAPEFARPILTHLRALVHRALPEVEETIKWNVPHFTINGKNLAGMAAFKAHCAFAIHGDGRQGDAMGQYGKIASLDDIREEDLAAKLQDAAARIASSGSAVSKRNSRPSSVEPTVPEDFAQALSISPTAQQNWDQFSPSARREYLTWFAEAKQAATRQRRLLQAAEWIAEGKKRNWKYER